jgi:hypothetical protein
MNRLTLNKIKTQHLQPKPTHPMKKLMNLTKLPRASNIWTISRRTKIFPKEKTTMKRKDLALNKKTKKPSKNKIKRINRLKKVLEKDQ